MRPNPKYLSFYYAADKEFKPLTLERSSTMLLIIDFQNEFVDREKGEAETFKKLGVWERWIPMHDRLDNIAIPNTKKLLDFFRANNMYVSYARIACQLESGEDRSPVTKTPGWNSILLPEDSWGAQIVDELAPIKGRELIISKTTDSVTTGTNYLQILRYMGIKTVVVTGMVTDQCVASSIRGLADDGLCVIAVEDACAAGDDALHDAELKIMNVIYCNVLSTDETINLIKNSK